MKCSKAESAFSTEQDEGKDLGRLAAGFVSSVFTHFALKKDGTMDSVILKSCRLIPGTFPR